MVSRVIALPAMMNSTPITQVSIAARRPEAHSRSIPLVTRSVGSTVASSTKYGSSSTGPFARWKGRRGIGSPQSETPEGGLEAGLVAEAPQREVLGRHEPQPHQHRVAILHANWCHRSRHL
jgi:hypothetical protein